MQGMRLIKGGMLAIVMMLAAFGARAAAPNAPVEFSGKVMYATNAAPYVILSWYEAKEGDRATRFDVYQASGQTEDLTKFDKIGSKDAYPADSIKERGRYTFEVRDLAAGTYTFFVRAVNADGESNRTQIKVLTIQKQEDRVVFVTEPSKTAWLNTLYEYNARAESNRDGKIVFSLMAGPDGLTCSDDGKVRWTPTKTGRYEVLIKAMVEGTDLWAKQGWVIEVKEKRDTTDDDGEGKKDECAFINGRVKMDGESAPVMTGWVVAWRVDREADDDDTTVDNSWRPVYKAKIMQGTYQLKVAAGTYKLVVEGPDFTTEWFEDSETADGAETITVECDKRYEAHFMVTGKPTPVKYEVRGRVTDAETGEGLKAKIVFENTNREEKRDERYRVIRVETNDEGYYEAMLPEGQSYIAVAQAQNRDNAKSPYLPEFWQETGDVTLATAITLTANMADVNFTLEKRPTYENGFSGQLKSAADPTVGVPGKVTAYLLVRRGNDDKPEEHKEAAATVMTDDQGNYRFENLVPGTYIVFGVPGERPFAPGWYVAGAEAAASWKDATRIEVGEVMLTVQHDILLRKGEGQKGKGRLRGWVYRRGGTIAKDGDDTQGGTIVGGAYVLVLDNKGSIVDYALTDADGLYDIPTLGIGTQTIVADRIGFDPATRTVTIDGAANAEQEVSLELVSIVSSVEIPEDLNMTSYNLYPNPASSIATVQFPSTTGTADITILTASGTVITTQTVNVDGGLTSATLNTASLPNGMYLVRIANGAHTFALPLTIVR